MIVFIDAFKREPMYKHEFGRCVVINVMIDLGYELIFDENHMLV